MNRPKLTAHLDRLDGFNDGYADRKPQRGRTGIYRNSYSRGRLARIADQHIAALNRIRGVEVSA